MPVRFSNNASATLASAITSTTTSITVSAGQGGRFPTLASGQFFFATLLDSSNNIEVVRCTARSGDTLTVVRGQDGTSARAYAAQDRLELRVTSAALNNKADIDGAVFSGDISVTKLNPFVGLYKTASGQSASIAAYTGTSARWSIELGNTAAETGSNIGSDFAIGRFNDAGINLDAPFSILRSSGSGYFANPLYVQSQIVWHAGNFDPAGKQNALGYTPVRQGGGTGQGSNVVYMGWSGTRLKAQVDTTDLGNVAFDSHLAAYLPLGGGTVTGDTRVSSGTLSVGSSTLAGEAMVRHQNSSRHIYHTLAADGQRFGAYDVNSGAWRYYSDASGNFVASGNVTAFSDARVKRDVSTITSALEITQKLRGVRYSRTDTGASGIGVIAQELREVLPELICEDGDGMLSVAYGNMVGVLIEAVKELTQRVKQLEAREG